MSVIRIARNKKPNSHRDFNDLEKTLNKLGTAQEFIDYFTPKIDPYALKAIPHRKFKDNIECGGVNPFYYMPDHRLKTFVKYMERTEQWRTENVDPIIDITNWVFTIFKDTTHLTTSECLALTIETQKRIRNTHPELIEWLENDNIRSERSAHAVTDIIHSVLEDFPSHWSEYMAQLERPTFKRHTKIENEKKRHLLSII